MAIVSTPSLGPFEACPWGGRGWSGGRGREREQTPDVPSSCLGYCVRVCSVDIIMLLLLSSVVLWCRAPRVCSEHDLLSVLPPECLCEYRVRCLFRHDLLLSSVVRVCSKIWSIVVQGCLILCVSMCVQTWSVVVRRHWYYGRVFIFKTRYVAVQCCPTLCPCLFRHDLLLSSVVWYCVRVCSGVICCQCLILCLCLFWHDLLLSSIVWYCVCVCSNMICCCPVLSDTVSVFVQTWSVVVQCCLILCLCLFKHDLLLSSVVRYCTRVCWNMICCCSVLSGTVSVFVQTWSVFISPVSLKPAANGRYLVCKSFD